MNEIKNILKNARKAKELTLAEVAKRTGIALTTINSWERGASYPRGKHREIIALFYGLPKDSLDYSLVNKDTGSRELDVSRLAMSDYETKQIMLHKAHWELADKLRKQAGDVDFSEMFVRLIKASASESAK